MKRITCYETSDGVAHKTLAHAERHADERYGALLTSLAHQLCRMEKYTQFQEFLEKNLGEFVTLAALHADKAVPPWDGDED